MKDIDHIDIKSINNNWLLEGTQYWYIAQSKPSAYGKANWYFEFWNSVVHNTLELIESRQANLMLVDYVNSRYTVINIDLIRWVRQNSSRVREDKTVSEFVVKKFDDGFCLVPYLTGTGLFKFIEVNYFG